MKSRVGYYLASAQKQITLAMKKKSLLQKRTNNPYLIGASLVVQWLRLHLPM